MRLLLQPATRHVRLAPPPTASRRSGSTASRLWVALALAVVPVTAHPAASECGEPARWTVRTGVSHERYSFASPGNGWTASLQNRSLRGWNVAAGVGYQHRFDLDDAEGWVSGSRRLPWGRSHAGMTVGGSTRHTLLPMMRSSGEGGFAIGGGFSAEGRIEYRRYDSADVYIASPGLAWEGSGLELSIGYSISHARYGSGARSGGLSSYRAQAAWTGWCAVKPWIGIARTREPFEAGSGRGASSFTADHYSAGAGLPLGRDFALNVALRHEARPRLKSHVNHMDAYIAYSWGRLR